MSQSRKRAFIWAASPEETLPEWPEPMHVFTGPELKVKLARNSHYAAVRSTANGAPFRAITVRDTIGDLPAVGNGASVTTMEVGFSSPVCDAHFIFIVVPSTKGLVCCIFLPCSIKVNLCHGFKRKSEQICWS